MNLRLRQIDREDCTAAEGDAAIVNYCSYTYDAAPWFECYYVVLEQWSDFKQQWEVVPLHHEKPPGSDV